MTWLDHLELYLDATQPVFAGVEYYPTADWVEDGESHFIIRGIDFAAAPPISVGNCDSQFMGHVLWECYGPRIGENSLPPISNRAIGIGKAFRYKRHIQGGTKLYFGDYSISQVTTKERQGLASAPGRLIKCITRVKIKILTTEV